MNRLHQHVFGALPTDAGAFAKRTSYRARDHHLLLWAHAALVDTTLLTYSIFVQPL